LNFKEDAFTVGASISLPLFSSQRSARAAEAGARAERLLAERGERDAVLRVAARQAEAAAGHAAVESGLLRREAGRAEETLRVSRVLLAEGRGEPADASEAEAGAATAAEAAARGAFDLFVARVRLLSLRGELPGLRN